MAIDMFDTRTMLTMVENLKPARTFLRDTVFTNKITFDSEVVDVDIVVGHRRLAPFVSPRVGSKTVDRAGYSTDTYKPVLVAPDMVTTVEDLGRRSAGQHVYGTQTPNDRMAAQMVRDMVELDDMITRREEWMCAQALFAGSIAQVGEGVNQVVTFSGINTTAPSTLWSAASPDILGDLRSWSITCLQKSGYRPTTAILGSDVVEAIMVDETLLKLLDNRRVDIGAIRPDQLPNGVEYIGYLSGLNLDLYAYHEWFHDGSSEQPMVPVKDVLLFNPNARMDMLYGAVHDVDEGSFAMPRVPKTWTQKKPSARFLQLSSRPLPVPHEAGSLYSTTVLS